MKRRRLVGILTIILLFTLALGGCSQEGANDSGDLDVETISIQHKLGEARLVKNPKNIVVFDYGTLDSLDKMGLEIGGLAKASLPEFLGKYRDSKYEDVGTLFEPDFEKIFEMSPHVIFISGRQIEVYEELSKIAPTIYFELDGANYMDSIVDNLTTLGDIFDKKELVEDELDLIKEEVEYVKDLAGGKGNGLIVLANDGSISAYGEDSRFGIIHKEFGIEPVDRKIELSTHGQNISFEYILEKNPDYIFVIDRAAVTGGSVSAEQIFDNEIIRQTAAYENNRIIYLDSQVWYVASGGIGGTRKMIEDIKNGLGD